MTGEFTAQRASNTENISIWWRHQACSRNGSLSSNLWYRSYIGTRLRIPIASIIYLQIVYILSIIKISFSLIPKTAISGIISSAPIYYRRLTLIQTWISNDMASKMSGDITYAFLNLKSFGGSSAEEWPGNTNEPRHLVAIITGIIILVTHLKSSHCNSFENRGRVDGIWTEWAGTNLVIPVKATRTTCPIIKTYIHIKCQFDRYVLIWRIDDGLFARF